VGSLRRKSMNKVIWVLERKYVFHGILEIKEVGSARKRKRKIKWTRIQSDGRKKRKRFIISWRDGLNTTKKDLKKSI